jgi:hypothetical protein
MIKASRYWRGIELRGLNWFQVIKAVSYCCCFADWKGKTKQRIGEEVNKMNERRDVTTQKEDTEGSLGLLGEKTVRTFNQAVAYSGARNASPITVPRNVTFVLWYVVKKTHWQFHRVFSWSPHRARLLKLMVTWCTNSLTFNNCTLCPHCIYVFCVYLITNSDLCHLQHKITGFYKGDEKCLECGTDWAFK